MSIKEKIHELVDKLEEREALKQLLEVTKTVVRTWEDDVELTPEQIKRLEKSLKESSEGKTYTWSEVKERLEKYSEGRSKKLKDSFHKLIDEIENDDILYIHLESLGHYHPTQLNKSGDVTDELSPPQIKRLEKALEHSKNGKTVSDEIARERIRKWFTE